MRVLNKISFLIFISSCLIACNSNGQSKNKKVIDQKIKLEAPKGKAIAAFAAGCFWCTEHVFESAFGVDSAVSGYAGGKTINPTYKTVSSETTGHAETTLVYYDPNLISYQDLLDVFFDSHDPTTLNQQGPDKGTSYRSVIFFQTPKEKELAKNTILQLNKTNRFKKPIVTEVTHLTAFYRAEEEHQNFVKQNPLQPYVKGVSNPRFEQFKRTTKKRLK
jgi:peptide-methionine (S)-S-oxide reductase